MRGNMGIHVKIIANSFLSEALYEEGCGLDHYNTRLVFGEGKEEEEEEEEGEGGWWGEGAFTDALTLVPQNFGQAARLLLRQLKC